MYRRAQPDPNRDSRLRRFFGASVPSLRRCVLLGSLLTVSCYFGDARFHVHRAPSLAQGAYPISVFGVYRDGHMSPNYWGLIGPEISKALGSDHCDTVFDDRLYNEDPTVYAKIDTDSKDDGITAELLSLVAPRAKSQGPAQPTTQNSSPTQTQNSTQPQSTQSPDPTPSQAQSQNGMILAISVFGHPPIKTSPSALGQTGQNSAGGGKKGGRGGGVRRMQADSNVYDDFEMSMSLYSIEQREIVLQLDMKYSGSSSSEAITQFAQEIHKMLPGSKCEGWRWKDGH